PVAIVETGTYLGTTTELLATCGVPVHTVEANERCYGFARARFWRGNVHVWLGDSRSGLRAILDGPLRSKPSETIFVYLDAHWEDDLPLAEELDIVFSNCPSAVVMIDDFQVPGDPGYRYDDYGSGKALTPGYIQSSCKTHNLVALYPGARSADETGARRGCVVLVQRDGP